MEDAKVPPPNTSSATGVLTLPGAPASQSVQHRLPKHYSAGSSIFPRVAPCCARVQPQGALVDNWFHSRAVSSVPV